MKCNLEVDGVFGVKTYSCVVKFQDKYNLETDGIVGKKTCNKLKTATTTEDVEDDFNLDGNKNIIVKGNEDDKITKFTIKDSNGKTIKNIEVGEILQYTSVIKKNDGTFYKVKLNNDYGYIKSNLVTKNFIVVDISMQKLLYYKKGQTILETEVITGMKNKHDTPIGVYTLNIKNKEKNRTLRGTNDDGSKYASPVTYWMPFITTRGIGFHDASWRSTSDFNDTTYIYNGSHGCVNMRTKDAKKMYNNLNSNITVIVRK